MKLIAADRVVYACHRAHTPIAEVCPGELIKIQTLDAREGRLTRPDEVEATAPDFSDPLPRTNPATGPIAVGGAEPGDAVVVEIGSIDLDNRAFVVVKPDVGIVQGLVSRPVATIMRVSDGLVHFSQHIRIPVTPMVGVLATAPSSEVPFPTAHVGDHGGNMDNCRITTGARVFLPVFVPGALLYIGDVHACMGDGEVCGMGAEVGATVELKLSVKKRLGLRRPYIETGKHLVTTASAPEFYDAAELAVRDMMDQLEHRLGLSPTESFMLISIAGDVRLNQACRSPVNVSVRVEMLKLWEPAQN